jgi:DNA-binding PadR family transcriptional regulator
MTGPEHRVRDPLLGEWACLGILYGGPAHGWAIAKQLRPAGDIGRIWHLSRPLTYRALDQLAARRWIEQVAEEPGDAGPNRTVLAVTRAGRSRFRHWLRTPVPHLRDLRSELLLKLVFAEQHHVDISDMLVRQRENIDEQAAHLTDVDDGDHDVVVLWRIEATGAAQRFLDQVHPTTAISPQPVTARGRDASPR